MTTTVLASLSCHVWVSDLATSGLTPMRPFKVNSNLCYNSAMPSISVFFGINVRMFYNEHFPPHFHVEYAEYKAEISIETLEVLAGKLPPRVLALILEWASQHRTELREDWNLCLEKKKLNPIQPLE